ncbi:MAG TPA: universal stress protein [Verrucomicrobiae bacterium]|nr:universal stress protein [Verrucomicrobiae bacterium]
MNILICTDGSEQAQRAIRLAAPIAAGCQAHVTLFGIIETPANADSIYESLKRGQALLAERKLNAEVLTRAGEPIAEIVRRTQEAAYDLVVIGATRKESGGLFWMSSKSYKIIKEIEPPVLSVAGNLSSLKQVLICSGGKSYIDAAVRLAGQIAHGVGAAATLLHVMPEPPAIYAGLPRMAETAAWVLGSNSELGRNLRQEQATLQSLGVPCEVRLRQGAVLEQILREIRDGNYELVVTGSALSTTLRTYVLGDVSREIVNRVHSAVLVVRSRDHSHHARRTFRGWWARP